MMMLEQEVKTIKLPKEQRVRKGTIFCDADRFKNVVRIDKDFFQVNSQRSRFIFHYVRRLMVTNADGRKTYYWDCSDCPGMKYFSKCWHVEEARKVYDRDPNFAKEIKA